MKKPTKTCSLSTSQRSRPLGRALVKRGYTSVPASPAPHGLNGASDDEHVFVGFFVPGRLAAAHPCAAASPRDLAAISRPTPPVAPLASLRIPSRVSLCASALAPRTALVPARRGARPPYGKNGQPELLSKPEKFRFGRTATTPWRGGDSAATPAIRTKRHPNPPMFQPGRFGHAQRGA